MLFFIFKFFLFYISLVEVTDWSAPVDDFTLIDAQAGLRREANYM